MKSTPEHKRLLTDEKAKSVNRANAARLLASDGFVELLKPVLNDWLKSDEIILRQEAITLLLGGFGFEQYVGIAIEMLKHDKHWVVRSDTVFALSSFVKRFEESKKHKREIIEILFQSMLNDEDEAVQEKSYKCLYEMFTEKQLLISKNEFDNRNDIDWEILQPHLEKYGLQKPS